MKLTWKRTVITGDELHHDFWAYVDNIGIARIMQDRDAPSIALSEASNSISAQRRAMSA